MRTKRLPAADQVRASHAAAGAQIYATTVDLVKDLARNPIVELVVAYVLIEKLQQQGTLSQPMGTFMEAGIAGIITAQQIAPLAPYLAQGAQGIAGGLGALGGLLALPGPP